MSDNQRSIAMELAAEMISSFARILEPYTATAITPEEQARVLAAVTVAHAIVVATHFLGMHDETATREAFEKSLDVTLSRLRAVLVERQPAPH